MNVIAVSIMMGLVGMTLATGMVARKKDGGRPTIQKLSSGGDLENEVYKSLGHEEYLLRKLHTRSLAHHGLLNHKGVGDFYQRSHQMRAGMPLFKYFFNIFKKLPLLGHKIRSLFNKLFKPQFTHLTPDGKKKYLELKKKYNLPDYQTLLDNAIPRKKETLPKDVVKRPHYRNQRKYGDGYRSNAMRKNKIQKDAHIIDRKYPEVDHTHRNHKPRDRYHYGKRAFTMDKYGMENVKLDFSKVGKDLKSELKHNHNEKKFNKINRAKEFKSGMKENQNGKKSELKEKQDNLHNKNDEKNTDSRSKKPQYKGKMHYGKRRFTMDKYGMENIKFDYSKLGKDLKDSTKIKKEFKSGSKFSNGGKSGSKNNKNLKNESENFKNGKSEKGSQINSKTE